MTLSHCANCGLITHEDNLDAKPSRLAGPGRWWGRLPLFSIREDAIDDAAYAGEEFDRLECRACYGPGFTQGTATDI